MTGDLDRDMYAPWLYDDHLFPLPEPVVRRPDDFCWKCDLRPIHELGHETECAAGLCDQCCTELRNVETNRQVA